MCGRFGFITPIEILRNIFKLNRIEEVEPNYNIAPTQNVPVIRETADARELVPMRWGLIPFWAKDISIGNKMINARAESLFEKPAFKQAVTRRRCLIPADGFYEWKKVGKAKQPYYIRAKEDTPLALAGMWDRWKNPDDGQELQTCTIITTEANELVAPLHDRMPVIVDLADTDTWLNPEVKDLEHIRPLLRPYDAKKMTFYPVSTRVNSSGYKGEECIVPLVEEGELF